MLTECVSDQKSVFLGGQTNMERRRVRLSCACCIVTGCIRIVAMTHLNKKFVQIFGVEVVMFYLKVLSVMKLCNVGEK
jgi:hypothetical protein